MKIVLVSKRSLDIEQNIEFKMSVLISPSKSLISTFWVTYILMIIIKIIIKLLIILLIFLNSFFLNENNINNI